MLGESEYLCCVGSLSESGYLIVQQPNPVFWHSLSLKSIVAFNAELTSKVINLKNVFIGLLSPLSIFCIISKYN